MPLRLILTCCILLAASFAHAEQKDGRLDFYWIDVEGGAATLIVTPAGESVLIDAGNPGRRDPSRIAEVATKVAGLRKINHLIVTHYHVDHFGGAAMLSKLLPIGTVYDNGEFAGQPDFPDQDYLDFACEKRLVVEPGDRLPLAQTAGPNATPLTLACVGTRQEFTPAADEVPENTDPCAAHRPKNRDGSDNANSSVWLLTFGPFRFFDAGDLTWNVEEKIVCPKNRIGQVDVYQVTHHGLDASNNPVVIHSLEPRVAIMNNGTTKGCAPEVFRTLRQTPSIEAVYQLHKNLRPDGGQNNVADEYIANQAENCTGNFIKLSVAPDGGEYTVDIPATKHQRRFKSRR